MRTDADAPAERGVTKDLQTDRNSIRYRISGKMFAAVLLDDQDQPYDINLKPEPLDGEGIRPRSAREFG